MKTAAFALKARMIVSPRASFDGAKLLAKGVDWPDIEFGTIWKGLDQNTAFYRTFTGKNRLWLGDEADAANAGVFTSINAGTSNGKCGFANGTQCRGENTYFGLAMNTFGNGADRIYCGRNALDGATMNRFVFLN